VGWTWLRIGSITMSFDVIFWFFTHSPISAIPSLPLVSFQPFLPFHSSRTQEIIINSIGQRLSIVKPRVNKFLWNSKSLLSITLVGSLQLTFILLLEHYFWKYSIIPHLSWCHKQILLGPVCHTHRPVPLIQTSLKVSTDTWSSAQASTSIQTPSLDNQTLGIQSPALLWCVGEFDQKDIWLV
jgi:hypothetical protein